MTRTTEYLYAGGTSPALTEFQLQAHFFNSRHTPHFGEHAPQTQKYYYYSSSFFAAAGFRWLASFSSSSFVFTFTSQEFHEGLQAHRFPIRTYTSVAAAPGGGENLFLLPSSWMCVCVPCKAGATGWVGRLVGLGWRRGAEARGFVRQSEGMEREREKEG